jgi:hypothetical protein
MRKIILAVCVLALFVGVSYASDPTEWTRTHIQGGSWWYNPYLDMNILTGGPVDLTSAGMTFSIDIRGFQNEYDWNSVNDNGTPADPSDDFLEPQHRTPYADCNAFLRAYDYTGATLNGYRDYGIIWATQVLVGVYTGGEPGDTWTTRMFLLDDALSQPFTDTDYSGGIFDPTSVDSFRFYGTDWDGNHGYSGHPIFGTDLPNEFVDYMDWANLLISNDGGTLVDVTMGNSEGGGIYGRDVFPDYITFEVVPEPGTIALLGFGLLSLLGLRRKK